MKEWHDWASPGTSLSDYRRYVVDALTSRERSSWHAAACRHTAQVPYTVFQNEMSHAMGLCRQLLSWEDQLAVCSWCRVRSGLVCLRHLNGRKSAARYQNASSVAGASEMLQSTASVFVRNGSCRALVLSLWVAGRTSPGTSLPSGYLAAIHAELCSLWCSDCALR